MGFVARLRRGTNIINLNASPFTVAANFVPPTVAETPQIAESSGKARRTGETHTTQAISVPIHAQGTTVEYIRNQVDIINSFLKRAGKPDDPILFEWRPDNYVSAQVILGQGSAYRSVEVLWGEMEYGGQYGWWDHSRIIPDCSLNLLVGPNIEGIRHLAAQAKGGVQEDWATASYGISRGVIVPVADEANGNYFLNPIFMNSSWKTGYSDGADATSAKNINPDYVLFGTVSVWIASASSTTGTFTCSLNVGDTNTHILSCYARRPDGGTIDANVAQMYYNGAAKTTNYVSMSNGWYRLWASVTGVASAVTAGILVKAANTLYADGFQLEKRAYPTPLMSGDFLGHSWLGAAMGSRSVRNTAYLRLPVVNLFDNYTKTIRIEWEAPMALQTFPISGDYYVFQSSSSANFNLYLSVSGTSGVASWYFMGDYVTATDYTARTKFIFHVTCDKGTYKLYINGALVKTVTSAYIDPASGYVYFGSDATPANHIGGTFGGLTVLNGSLSATEVLADYTANYPLLGADQPIDPILYVWTKDGDSIVDYMDTGDGTYENIAVIGGVQGSLQAKTEIKATVAGMNNADVYIGNLDVDYNKFINPEFLTYEGSPSAITIDTSDTTIATLSIDDDEFLLLAGKQLAVMVRGDEDGSNDIKLRLGISPGGAYYYSKYDPSVWIASSTNVSNDLTPALSMVADEELYRILGITRAVSVRVLGKRPTGSATFNLHSVQIMPFPMIRLINTSASGIAPTILYIDGRAYEINSAALSYTYNVRGSKKEFGLLPGRYNLLVSYIGTEGVATGTSNTLTYSAVYVTPRWAIL